ncbi:MAG: riboflavin synthase [Burkholderiales bacterium]
MFTGIVEAQGTIAASTPLEKGERLRIASTDLDLADVKIGDSIAVNGCCLTVVTLGKGTFEVDVSKETLDCTAGFARGSAVNLEKALRLSDRLGGHLVTGHVDGVGKVTRFEQVGESWLLDVRAPKELAKYIARKGSITVNGVSLTVNHVSGDCFDVNLIPHTIEVTNLKELRAGAVVNLEIDLIARYVERLTATD